ncbi:MAG: FAD-dependent oxidoreductase [Aquificaceae bacterium]|nr:FAD-dependent oxidoreductase [Aquificaceae bacterium]MDW8434246.1 FAD-dependent oxidoreductase [Aquificaceae bacterium]
MRKIIVVGSGIIGLSCVVYLALEGERVQVITRNPEEASSWVAGGMLAPFSEGLEGELFDFSYESLKAYPEFVKLLENVSGQRVDFWHGGIHRVVLRGEEELLGVALNYARKGYKTEVIKEPTGEFSSEVSAIVHYLEEGWVDTEKLRDALFSALKKLNVELIVDQVVRVERSESRIEQVLGLKSSYRGDAYIFAIGAWSRELFDIPVYPLKGQFLKLRGYKPQRVCYSSVSYLIPRENYIYVGATSEDVGFMGGNTLEGMKKLSEGAMRVLPYLSSSFLLDFSYGYRPATPDEKPIFETGDNYIIATGHYRNGILHAPITAYIAKEYIKGKRSYYIDVFSCERFTKGHRADYSV